MLLIMTEEPFGTETFCDDMKNCMVGVGKVHFRTVLCTPVNITSNKELMGEGHICYRHESAMANQVIWYTFHPLSYLEI
jgi:hypothetical protein